MKHYRLTQWTDFVRGVVEDRKLESAMEEHLASGCAGCRRTVDLLREVAAVAESESLQSPPEHVLRSVKAYFALQQPHGLSKWSALPLWIAFDSALAPLPVGVRGEGQRARHLVCHTEEFALDLQTAREAGAREMVMVGQLVGSAVGPLSEVPAFVISRGEIVSRAFTGPRGEFQMSFAPTDAVRLCLLLDDEAAIDLSIDLPQDQN